MKISKLFHWLYAILMLLPFLVFLPNAFYYGFNEHAVAQEKETYPNITVNFNQLINDDNGYTFTTSTNNQQVSINYNDIDITHKYLVHNSNVNIKWQIWETELLNNDWGIQGNANRFTDINNNYYLIDNFTYTHLKLRNLPFNYNFNENQIDYVMLIDLTLMYGDGNEPSILEFTNNFPQQYYNYIHSKIITIYDFNNPITTNMSITDSMSFAWDSVWQNDLFSWSYGSFLTEPFIYIGNVFNVPVDNSLYYALSYWLDISIIWLCFDLVMYIPLLVHRWLDKGIIE